MQKDFDGWNDVKKKTHIENSRPFFREREVWWASLGLNRGFEQDGGKGFVRPVLVVKRFSGDACWCVPLTKQGKQGVYYEYVTLRGSVRSVILSQLRLLDTKRLQNKIGILDEEEFVRIKTKLTRFLV